MVWFKWRCTVRAKYIPHFWDVIKNKIHIKWLISIFTLLTYWSGSSLAILGKVKYMIKINFTYFFFLFIATTREFKILFVAHIIFLLFHVSLIFSGLSSRPRCCFGSKNAMFCSLSVFCITFPCPKFLSSENKSLPMKFRTSALIPQVSSRYLLIYHLFIYLFLLALAQMCGST